MDTRKGGNGRFVDERDAAEDLLEAGNVKSYNVPISQREGAFFMDINLTTPALLFPAISLLLLAFTNRFLALANLIRQLHANYKTDPDELLFGQIANLRYRINLIRDMQAFGVSSLLLCVICMLALFAGWVVIGQWIFVLSLVLMAVSLAISIREIQISVGALDLHLKDLEKMERNKK
jgi:hypothetical protein